MDWLHMCRHYRHVWNTRHWTDFRRGGTVFTRVRPFVCLFLCSWSGLRGKFSGDFSETLLDYGLREEVVKFWSWSYTQNGRKYVRGSHNPPTYFYSYLCPPLTTTERLMYWTSVDQCDLSYWCFSVTVTVTVMKTFELQLIFDNNCNRYLIQLLLQSKYHITEQNLAVLFCQHFIVN